MIHRYGIVESCYRVLAFTFTNEPVKHYEDMVVKFYLYRRLNRLCLIT